MDDEHKVEKSRLCNEQTKELKSLEKELKKKKGSLRDALEKKIEETKKRHEDEIEELAVKYGAGSKKPAQGGDQTSKGQEGATGYYFPERNWSSLGKKDLEVEVVKRGLGKKGNREELVTKLMIFGTDQKKKVEDGLIDPKNVYPEEKGRKQKGRKAVETDSDSDDEEDEESSGQSTPADPSKFLKKSVVDTKKTDVAGGGAKESDSSDDEDSDSSDEDESGEDDDVADADKIRGSGKEDLRSSHKRSGARRGRGGRGGRGRGGRGGGAANNNDEGERELTPEERQQKRERVMQQVLLKLLAKKPEGVLIDDIGLELRRLNVQNFRAELLGYESVEDWIRNQPPHMLYFDAEQRKILPSRVDTLPEDE